MAKKFNDGLSEIEGQSANAPIGAVETHIVGNIIFLSKKGEEFDQKTKEYSDTGIISCGLVLENKKKDESL